uniref:Acetyl-CoA carboxylase biotin carboxylase subunit protein n=1 Tax=uncultured bacterium CSL132 TaxID=1091568 RepID=G4WVL1_9BACT|nr:acetyl-CoA carboxylase biotin carboxylase subunit protein [uncultured bacterium CSL132]
MDLVIKLDHTQDYQPEMGAAFTVEFEKARHLSGDDARNLEASLARDQQDNHVWVWKDAEMGISERIQKLHAEAPDLNQSQLAEELGCNRSTVCRVLKNATIDAAGGMQ